MGSVRVVLEPVPLAATGTFEGVTRARVRLVSNGAGASLAGQAPQSAELVFSLALIRQARPGAAAPSEPIATLTAPLRLDGADERPIMDATEAELISLVKPAAPGVERAGSRGLQLDLDPGSFGAARSFFVALPDVGDDVQKLELRAELKIGGATESPETLNGIFDSFFGKVEINEVKIVSLKFLTDHQVLLDNNVDFSARGKPIGQPEWQYGKPSRPIVHTKGQKVEVELELEVYPLNAEAVDATVLGEALFEPKTPLTFRLKQSLQGGKFTLKLKSAEALPDQIEKLKGVIRWSVEAPKAKKKLFDAGDSFGHVVYLSFGKPVDPPEREAGITQKRVESAVDLVSAASSNEPHQVIRSLMGKVFPFYTIDRDPSLDKALDHPRFFNDSGGAWRALENLQAAAECQAIVRVVRAIGSVLGMPGTYDFVLATADADTGLPFEEPGETGRGLTDERRTVNGREGHPFLIPEEPPRVGTIFEIGGPGAPSLNFFEACLRFSHQGVVKLYPGGTGSSAPSFDDVDAVIRSSFRALILVSDVPPATKDGPPRARLEKVVKTYSPP